MNASHLLQRNITQREISVKAKTTQILVIYKNF
jgi:hypothetical protein